MHSVKTCKSKPELWVNCMARNKYLLVNRHTSFDPKVKIDEV